MREAFGPLLARLRRSRGLSQQRLAADCGISQRHLSFLESGRSRPGPRALSRLLAVLAPSRRDADRLLACAGLLPSGTDPTPKRGAEASCGVQALDLLVQEQSVFPAIAYRRDGEVLRVNEAFERLLRLASPRRCIWRESCGALPPNLYDLTLHPQGLRPFMVNPWDVIPRTLRRLSDHAPADLPAAATLRRVMHYLDDDASGGAQHGACEEGAAPERYRVGAATIALVSAITSIEDAGHGPGSGAVIETFLPHDRATAALLSQLAPGV